MPLFKERNNSKQYTIFSCLVASGYSRAKKYPFMSSTQCEWKVKMRWYAIIPAKQLILHQMCRMNYKASNLFEILK